MLAAKQLRAASSARQTRSGCSRSVRLACSAAARGNAGSAAAAAAAAVLINLSSSGALLAAPLYDNLPGFGGDSPNPFFQAVRSELAQRGPDLDDLFDENLMTEDLRKFVDSVMNGKMKPEDYQAERLKMNFRRDADGRVSLRSRQGQWFSVRPDMEAPGFLLLRDQGSGAVWFLPPDDGSDGLAQLDLSDDVVVAELFYSSAWQDVMAPFTLRDEAGRDSPLRLGDREFRQLVSLVDGAEEPEEQELEPAAQ